MRSRGTPIKGRDVLPLRSFDRVMSTALAVTPILCAFMVRLDCDGAYPPVISTTWCAATRCTQLNNGLTGSQRKAIIPSSAFGNTVASIAEITARDPVFVVDCLDRPDPETDLRYGTIELIAVPMIEVIATIATA